MNSQQLECTEKVVSDLMMEIARLRNERDEWKSNCSYLIESVEKLQADNELLHNMIENQEKTATIVDGGNDLSYIDEYAKGNSEWDNYSLKELDWNIAQ